VRNCTNCRDMINESLMTGVDQVPEQIQRVA
jgi:hypothetical protein